jgi:diguanylate cyclase (GGDEF)-like protein
MDTNLVSLSTQAAGSAVIGIITLLLARALHRPYVWYWTAGWLSQALGLWLLLAALRAPASFLLLAPLALFAQYVFGFLLVAGCANYATGARPTPRHRWWLLASAVLAVALGVAASASLHVLLLVHAPVLAGVFGAAWRALRPARDARRARLGLEVASIALVLLAILFLHYGPALVVAQWRGHEHLAYLQHRWLYDLILETLLGFGLIMLVLETVAAELRDANLELARARDRLEVQARVDPLTEVFNRHAFYSLLETPEAGRPHDGCAVVVDVDNLKRVNDWFGHAAGDATIRAAAKAVRGVVRPDDMLFRWGGDEFLVLVFGMTEAEARARMATLNRVAAGGSPEVPALSWGVARFDTERAIGTAIERADDDMYAHRRERRVTDERGGSTRSRA